MERWIVLKCHNQAKEIRVSSSFFFKKKCFYLFLERREGREKERERNIDV